MLKDFCIEAFSRPVSDLADNPLLSAGKLKEHFDSNSYELLESLNGLINELSGENGLEGLKISGKDIKDVLNEINKKLAEKVDKEDGKDLSSNDYTTEEKQKLSQLYNYNDSEVKADISALKEKDTQLEAELSDKAEKTDVEAFLSKKADASQIQTELSKKANTEDVNNALAGKVDKETGKGLSEADFTNLEKQKLANLPEKLIKIEESELDDIQDGVYLVHFLPEKITDIPESGEYDEDNEKWEIVIQSSRINYFYGGEVEADYIVQRRYGADGVFERFKESIGGSYGDWIEKYAVVDDLESSANTAALSANMGRVLNEKINDTVHYKGEAEETSLPTEGNLKGDVYKLAVPVIEKQYVTGSIGFYEWTETDGYFYVDGAYSLMTEEEKNIYNEYSEDWAANGNITPFNISVDFYNDNWEYVGTAEVYYDDAPIHWVFEGYSDYGKPEWLTEGNTYNLVRTDEKTSTFTLPTHIFEAEPDLNIADYALYNGESFDKFYASDAIDEKIGNIETNYLKKDYTKITELEITEEDITNAGEDGITAVFVGEEDENIFLPYKDFALHVLLPKSSDINSGGKPVVFGSTGKLGVTGYSEPTICYFFRTTHTTCLLKYDIQGDYILEVEQISDDVGHAIFTLDSNSAPSWGGVTYSAVTSFNSFNVKSYNANKYMFICSYNGDFKFPAGTKVTVYGK